VELEEVNFYELMSPRPIALISTVDSQGRPNAAPFSFVSPISTRPPLVAFAAAPQRHTLANIRETGEFVINIVPEELLEAQWICAKAFDKGVDEIKESGLTEISSKEVKPPRIEECLGWLECRFEFERETGNHVLVVGRVVQAEGKAEFLEKGRLDIPRARPLLHVWGRRFVAAERTIVATSY
jgi:flavin reductase (DIM6/NTAB) family NADH-FMN oxidoreductase RutF